MKKSIKYGILLAGLFFLSMPQTKAATELECQYQIDNKKLVELDQSATGIITTKYYGDYTNKDKPGTEVKKDILHYYTGTRDDYKETAELSSCPSYLFYTTNFWSTITNYYFTSFPVQGTKITSESTKTAYLSSKNGLVTETNPCSKIAWSSMLSELEDSTKNQPVLNICLYGFDNGSGTCQVAKMVFGESGVISFTSDNIFLKLDYSNITAEKLKPYYGVCPDLYGNITTTYQNNSNSYSGGGIGGGVGNTGGEKHYSFDIITHGGWDFYDFYAGKDTKQLTLQERKPINTCEELIPGTIIAKLNDYMTILRIAVPILIILLGTIDFAGAVLAADDDKMKKAQSRFVKRLLIGLLIFFIPTFVKLLLKIANAAWATIGTGTCGIS